MSEHDPVPAERAVIELDEFLLDARLSIPDPHPGSVSRAGLIEAARASGCRVVGVTAPAGYGKSTLLVEWAAGEDRRVAWVALDRFDDDPAVVLTLLASAFARIAPGNSDLIADMRGLGVSVLGRAAPRLAAALRTSPVPFVLMLDDLHDSAVTGLPRRAQRGDLRDSARLATGRGQSFRATPPAAAAGQR